MNGKLTKNQQIFVDEYLVDRNGTRAYKTAYPNVKKDETARVCASQLLTKPNINKSIEIAITEQQKRTEVTADKTIKETANLAFSNIQKYFDETGKLLPIEKWSADDAAAVSSIEVVTKPGGEGEVEQIHKIRLWDKNSALEKLGKHFKLFIDRQEITGKDGNPLEGKWTIEVVRPNGK